MLEVLHCVKKGYPKCRSLYILSLEMPAAVLVLVRLRGETDTASLEEHFLLFSFSPFLSHEGNVREH
jgi:hypothetical protein